MEKLLSSVTRVLLVLAVFAVVLAVPLLVALWLFWDALPRRFDFENLPLWLKIPVGCLVGLYCILEIWVSWKDGFGRKSNSPKA